MAATLRHARVDADLWDAAVAALGDSGISEARLLRAGLYALTMLPPADKLRCMERAERQAGWPRASEGS